MARDVASIDAQSTVDPEFVGFSFATREGLWIYKVVHAGGDKVLDKPIINTDESYCSL